MVGRLVVVGGSVVWFVGWLVCLGWCVGTVGKVGQALKLGKASWSIGWLVACVVNWCVCFCWWETWLGRLERLARYVGKVEGPELLWKVVGGRLLIW